MAILLLLLHLIVLRPLQHLHTILPGLSGLSGEDDSIVNSNRQQQALHD